jgi:hypothetical protein
VCLLNVSSYMVKKPTEVGFLSFCYEVCLTLGSFLKLPMRKRNRLHLLDLLDLESSPTLLSTLLLFALSKPWQAHQKHTMGGSIVLPET